MREVQSFHGLSKRREKFFMTTLTCSKAMLHPLSLLLLKLYKFLLRIMILAKWAMDMKSVQCSVTANIVIIARNAKVFVNHVSYSAALSSQGDG